MCECLEYEDGSMFLCPVDADIIKNKSLPSLERECTHDKLFDVCGECRRCKACNTDELTKLRAELAQAEKVIELSAILNLAIRLHKSADSIIMANRYLGEGIKEYFAAKPAGKEGV